MEVYRPINCISQQEIRCRRLSRKKIEDDTSGYLIKKKKLHGTDLRGELVRVCPQLAKKFLAFDGTHKFITALTRASTCPYPEPHLSRPPRPSQPNSSRSTLTQSSHLH